MEKIKPTYSELLMDPRWQKKRLEIMQRDEFTCQKCNHTKTTLNVHHIEYIKALKPWEYPEEKLITLCKFCHLEIEELKKKGDKTPFTDIAIFNIFGEKDNPIRISFILHGSVCSLKEYSGDKLIVHYPFGRRSVNNIVYQMFKRACYYEPQKSEVNNDVFGDGKKHHRKDDVFTNTPSYKKTYKDLPF
jgi:hypothetical protein